MNMQELMIMAGVITFAALWMKHLFMDFVSMIIWWFVAVFVISNPPWGLVAGDAKQQMLVVALFAVGIAIPFIGAANRDRERSSNPEMERPEGFNFKRFLSSGDTGSPPTVSRESTQDYRAKVYKALHPNPNHLRRRY